MSFLNDLLEYESPLSPGVKLEDFPSFRYHRTKAGLYVVLEYDSEGGFRIPGGDDWIACGPTIHEPLSLPDGFSFEDLQYKRFDGKVFIESFTAHKSGVKIRHGLSEDRRIINLDMRLLSAGGFPLWYFCVDSRGQKPEVRGGFNYLQTYGFHQSGKVEKLGKPPVKLSKRTINFENSLYMMLVSMYRNDQNVLHSLSFLRFK